MRVFAVILVLAVLSGNVHISPWEVTINDFQEYLSNVREKANEMVNNIRTSQISREIDTLIQDSMSELAMYRDDVQTRLAPYTQEAAERLGSDLQNIGEKLRTQAAETQNQMEKYTEELQTMMQQSIEDINTRFSTYSRKLRKRLNKDAEELKTNIADYIGELQSRTSNNMEEMRIRLDPYFAQVRDNAQAKITTLNELLKTAEDIKDAFKSTANNMRSTVEEKMSAIRSWFQPYVAMISDNL
uniref:Apolipoprotein Ea n=1 Tax=Echeneis naucrates TaxID=173247 RepID=A0A665VYV0_ECHNA